MEQALRNANAVLDSKEKGALIKILTGDKSPAFNTEEKPINISSLNKIQQQAVNQILSANELAIVHGPPGTGKTTT